MKIFAYTLSMGREYYLKKCLDSIYDNWPREEFLLTHTIFLQGEELKRPRTTLSKIIQSKTNKGIANAMNILHETDEAKEADIIMKIDEDCELQSKNFFMHVGEVALLIPNTVFSPYPVGLINNPGGTPAIADRIVAHSQRYNTYYTLRPVKHIGGFARVMPAKLRKLYLTSDLIPGISGNEDAQISQYCLANDIPMVYLENGLIVEHQESTLGQHQRYKEYFKGRF